ncbi:glucuronate isomerase [Caproiciproducens galactitolivorans]|uniref:Uronate isomerase n=1 Tax=Caproiciproducens galactitolivorans TaxID=642589 RepID=A0A4Z0YJD0_9FIRM|nr:glucuronate isomerase [Caproiciproducens galactitolivorans]QEY35286.1 glucuronate isomerase [Caproiciproducens galactitolivorans]TGJ76982.1 uronate isomerase [Caproiciproducens galactitolivorans]
MKAFMDKDFLLSNETAKTLFHEYAEQMPIIDYHCHIPPQEIAQDRKFHNITEVWLGGDHYKWRMIRSNGIDEEKITGSASDREKFQMFAEALPKAIGNPLYHWTHLELQRYFGYHGELNGETAETVWNLCNEKLKSLSVRKIIESSRVETIVTTDDPADDLRWHKAIREDASCKVKVLPAWRPDKIMNIGKPDFAEYVKVLSEASNTEIRSMDDVYSALSGRLAFFHSMGCRASDHGLDAILYRPAEGERVQEIFERGLAGEPLSQEEIDSYKYAVLSFLAREYAKRGWVMQLHYGALRDANTPMYKKMGPDTGFDCIGASGDAKQIAAFLNDLNSSNTLPKTVLYSLNPNDNAMLDTIIGCFQGTEAAGKIQHGAAWWFNDTKHGMEAQMISLASLSLLGNFIGMLTDSRSFLSYTRHEYFRRILCNLIGGWVENGEVPCNLPALGKLVQDISYNNVKKYFGF